MTARNDQVTWHRILKLLGPFHDQAATTARRLSRNLDDGDDLIQEAVLRAFAKLPALRDEARFRRQIQAAGFDVTDVEYRSDGDKLTYKITTTSCGPNTAPEGESQCPDIDLTAAGQSPSADGQQLKIRIEAQPGDADEAIRQRILEQVHA
jgi:hypothetical protein